MTLAVKGRRRCQGNGDKAGENQLIGFKRQLGNLKQLFFTLTI